MNGFDFENAFGQPPAEFREGMVRALAQVKEGKPMKRFTARTLILAAALLLMLCGIALAVSATYGVEWFLTQRYADPPVLPSNFQEQVQSGITQENTGDFADVTIRDAAWLDDPKYHPNTFLLTLGGVLKDPNTYEMHQEFSLNTDGDTSERNDEDWLWTEKGHGPIPEMMTDPSKKLVFFDSGKLTIGTPDGFEMPGYGEDTLLAQDGSVLCYLTVSLNYLDESWLREHPRQLEPAEAQKYLEQDLQNAKAYQEAKAKYTGADGLTTLVFNYAVWEYPDWQNDRHQGYVAFKVKLP